MASWRYSIGNLLSRAPAAPAAVAPAVSDNVAPLSNWGSGYPDQVGGFAWRSDGSYAADLDLNLLAAASSRADAPTGWSDLLLSLAGTPGLPADPPDWDTYAGRSALRIFRPTAQEIDVMPGETVQWVGGIYRPSGASGATGVEVRVVDLTTGKQYDAVAEAWDHDGQVDAQSTADTWKDATVTIAADASHGERRRYRVVVSPIAASYGPTSYVYVTPAVIAAVDTFALIGHNIPSGATVQLAPQPSGTAITLTLAQPSCYAVATTAVLARTWRLSVSIPSALRPSAPRPLVGEPWVGTARSMLVGSPIPTFGGEEGAPGQLRVEGPRKRLEVVADDARPVEELQLSFRARDDAAFRQMRDEVMRLTRYGADPLLIFPGSTFEGGRPYHGRVEDRLAWDIITPTETGSARSFAMAFVESPFAAP